MSEKKSIKVSRQTVELARLHVEAARRAGRKPEPGIERIASARPGTGNGAPATA
jgi:hypothetical protein